MSMLGTLVMKVRRLFAPSTQRSASRELMKAERLSKELFARFKHIQQKIQIIERRYLEEKDPDLRKIIASEFEKLGIELDSLKEDMNLNQAQIRQLVRVVQVAKKPILNADTLQQYAQDMEQRMIEIQLSKEKLKNIESTLIAAGGFSTEIEVSDTMREFEARMQQKMKGTEKEPQSQQAEPRPKLDIHNQTAEPKIPDSELLKPGTQKALNVKPEQQTEPESRQSNKVVPAKQKEEERTDPLIKLE